MCQNWGAGGVARSVHKGSEIVDMDSHSGWGAGDTTSPHGLVGWWGLSWWCWGYCKPFSLSACQRAVVVGIAVYSF